jgi:hypothetical protein
LTNTGALQLSANQVTGLSALLGNAAALDAAGLSNIGGLAIQLGQVGGLAAALGSKANTSDIAALANVDLPKLAAIGANIGTMLDGKANLVHTHAISEIDGLVAELANLHANTVIDSIRLSNVSSLHIAANQVDGLASLLANSVPVAPGLDMANISQTLQGLISNLSLSGGGGGAGGSNVTANSTPTEIAAAAANLLADSDAVDFANAANVLIKASTGSITADLAALRKMVLFALKFSQYNEKIMLTMLGGPGELRVRGPSDPVRHTVTQKANLADLSSIVVDAARLSNISALRLEGSQISNIVTGGGTASSLDAANLTNTGALQLSANQITGLSALLGNAAALDAAGLSNIGGLAIQLGQVGGLAAALGSKANTSDIAALANVDLPKLAAIGANIGTMLDGKANLVHTHAISEIDGLVAELANLHANTVIDSIRLSNVSSLHIAANQVDGLASLMANSANPVAPGLDIANISQTLQGLISNLSLSGGGGGAGGSNVTANSTPTEIAAAAANLLADSDAVDFANAANLLIKASTGSITADLAALRKMVLFALRFSQYNEGIMLKMLGGPGELRVRGPSDPVRHVVTQKANVSDVVGRYANLSGDTFSGPVVVNGIVTADTVRANRVEADTLYHAGGQIVTVTLKSVKGGVAGANVRWTLGGIPDPFMASCTLYLRDASGRPTMHSCDVLRCGAASAVAQVGVQKTTGFGADRVSVTGSAADTVQIEYSGASTDVSLSARIDCDCFGHHMYPRLLRNLLNLLNLAPAP